MATAEAPQPRPPRPAAARTRALFGPFDERRAEPVALLGRAAASELGISSLAGQPAVFIGSTAYTVVGIIAQSPRLPGLGLDVVIPAATALSRYGPPAASTPAEMLIHTRLGAAQLIARQAPVALNPGHPHLFASTTAPGLSALQHGVSFTVDSLLLLAGIALATGALSIANTTLVAVLERTNEIGLRRGLGARRLHIAAQFLAESTVLGGAGGLIGTSLGVMTVVGVALSRQWTAVVPPAVVFPAPLAGALVGLLAGLYPALKAATIEPAAALRR